MQNKSELWLHTIFPVEGYEDLLLPSFQKEVYELIRGSVVRQGCELYSIGGTTNHVHFIVGMNLDLSVDMLLKKVKLSSQTDIRHRFDADFLWEEGYYAFSIGADELDDERVSIDNELTKHKYLTLEQELEELREDLSMEESDDLTDISEILFN